jgi:hypothetical protein
LRIPDAAWRFVPAYCQVVMSYWPLSASQPEKSPSRSSVSTKRSSTMVAALV